MDDVPDIIGAYLAAYNEFDVDGMVATLSDDVRFVNRSGDEITAETHGIDAFRSLAEQGAALFTKRCQTIRNCIAGAGHAMLRIDYRATVAADLPNGWKAGQEIRLEGMSLVVMRDGRIVELTDMS